MRFARKPLRASNPIDLSGTVPVTITAPPTTEFLAGLPWGKRSWWLRPDTGRDASFVDIPRASGLCRFDQTINLKFDCGYVLGVGTVVRHRFVVDERTERIDIGADGSVTFGDVDPSDPLGTDPLGTVLTPAIARGPLGTVLTPAIARGPLGTVLTPAIASWDSELAIAETPATSTVEPTVVEPTVVEPTGAPTDPHHVAGAPAGSVAYGVTYPTGLAAFTALGALRVAGLGSTVVVKRGPWPSPFGSPSTLQPAALDYPGWTDDTCGTCGTGHHQPGCPEGVDPEPTPGPSVPSRAVQVFRLDRADRARDIDARDIDAVIGAQPSVASTFTTPAYQVSRASLDRQAEDAADLLPMGIVPPPTAVIQGGVINSTGRANLSRSHAEYHANPLTIDACTALARTVAAEDRRDWTLTDCPAMGPDGTLTMGTTIGHKHRVSVEDRAFTALVAQHRDGLPGADKMLRRMTPADRACTWNSYAPEDTRWTGNAQTRDTVVRTRRMEAGDRAIFGVVTDGYTPFDADRIADVARTALLRVKGGSEARGEVTYSPDDSTVTIDGTWHAQGVHDFGAGDMISGGVRITGNDVGGGAIRVYPTAFFNLCFNLIITSRVNGDVTRIIHRGDADSMADRLAEAIKRAGDMFAPFVQRWGYARDADLVPVLIAQPSMSPSLNLRAIFNAIAGSPVDGDLPLVTGAVPELDWSGVRRDTLVEALLDAHRGQPGNQRSSETGTSIADVLSAVTRLHADSRIPIPVLARAEAHAGVLLSAFGA